MLELWGFWPQRGKNLFDRKPITDDFGMNFQPTADKSPAEANLSSVAPAKEEAKTDFKQLFGSEISGQKSPFFCCCDSGMVLGGG